MNNGLTEADYKTTVDVQREFFGEENFLIATGIVINRLVRDDFPVEIEAMAIIG